MSSTSHQQDKPVLQPSTLGKLVKLENCPQYFKFKIENEGIEELSNDPEEFTEAFHGGNIVEAEAGNEFESDVVDVIKEHTSTFYNIEETTIGDVAVLIPEVVTNILTEIGDDVKLTDVINGDFDYYGLPAEEITLNDVDTIYDNAPSDVDKKDVKNRFYEMRAEYTTAIIKEIVMNQNETYTQPDVRDNESPIVLFQGTFKEQIGDWMFAGDADLIFIWPENDTQIHVIDVKLSKEEQTNHQLQTVIYSNAIETIVNNTVEIKTGVLTPKSEFLPLRKNNLPEFNRSSREADLKRLTKQNGVLDTIFNKDYDETRFQLNDKCATCEYNEACYTMAIEEAGLELLNINRGAQRELEAHGVTDLNDLAQLAEPVEEYVHPVKDSKPRSAKQHRETYRELSSITGIGEQLPQLIQQAQGLLQNINPDNRKVNETNDAPLMTNTGYGNLPNDERIFDNSKNTIEYCEGSMIRVYVNVQFDHIRDVIVGIGFTVCATASTTEPISDVFFDTVQPDDTEKAREIEHELLEGFSESVLHAIKEIESGINFSEYDQSDPFIHVYTYSEDEKQSLQKTLAMHSKDKIQIESSVNNHKYNNGDTQTVNITPTKPITGLRNLITKENNKDEENCSAVVTDIEKRFAIREPTTGLINVYKEFYANSDEAFRVDDWKYTPKIGGSKNEVDLTDVFGYRFFDNNVGYTEKTDAINLLHTNTGEDYDGWLNSRFRQAAQVPIAYLWSATGKLEEKISTDDSSNIGIPINPFIFRDGRKQEHKITSYDVEVLIERLTQCLQHVERGISKKEAVTIPNQEYEHGVDAQQKNEEVIQ